MGEPLSTGRHTPPPYAPARPRNPSAPITSADFDRPADLTLWPGHAPARFAIGRSYPTLRAALAAAAEAIDAEDANAWIVTEAGDILAPNWIRANTASHRLQ